MREAPDNRVGRPQPGNLTVVYPPMQQTVIMSPAPAESPTPDAAPETQPTTAEATSAPEPEHYLIAFKDHTIYAAVAYWVEGDTLHYFTAGNTHNQVSLSLVDTSLTERLNRESGVTVRLP